MKSLVVRGDSCAVVAWGRPLLLLYHCQAGRETSYPRCAWLSHRFRRDAFDNKARGVWHGDCTVCRRYTVLKEGENVAVAKITGQGLSSIAILVALLWGCLIAERVIVYQANAEVFRTVRANHDLQLRRRVQPASSPIPKIPRRARAVEG